MIPFVPGGVRLPLVDTTRGFVPRFTDRLGTWKDVSTVRAPVSEWTPLPDWPWIEMAPPPPPLPEELRPPTVWMDCAPAPLITNFGTLMPPPPPELPPPHAGTSAAAASNNRPRVQ